MEILWARRGAEQRGGCPVSSCGLCVYVGPERESIAISVEDDWPAPRPEDILRTEGRASGRGQVPAVNPGGARTPGRSFLAKAIHTLSRVGL
jgi:hypothetical protein